jgi:hypothetical protein
MIPKGTYRARATDCALGMTASGKEQVGAALEILEGEHAGESLTWYGYFTEKTLERTLESLRHLGWKTDDLSDLAGVGDAEVAIVVDHEEDQNGTLRARVRWVNAPGSGGIAMKDRLDGGAAKAFALRMKGAAVASRSKVAPRNASAPRQAPARTNGTVPRTSSQEEASPFDADDTPF